MHPSLLPVETHVSATDSLPDYSGGVYLCSISHLIIMFTIQYWDGRFAEWRGCGQPTCPDADNARVVMRALREQSHGYVEFRAVQTIAG